MTMQSFGIMAQSAKRELGFSGSALGFTVALSLSADLRTPDQRGPAMLIANR